MGVKILQSSAFQRGVTLSFEMLRGHGNQSASRKRVFRVSDLVAASRRELIWFLQHIRHRSHGLKDLLKSSHVVGYILQPPRHLDVLLEREQRLAAKRLDLNLVPLCLVSHLGIAFRGIGLASLIFVVGHAINLPLAPQFW